jgi:N-acetylmuramoyl-L-alanine amidase
MSKKILVVLDPGHKPNYNKGAAPGYYEGNKMYTLTEYERDALEAYGIDVVITRKRENDMTLNARGQVAVKNGKGYDEVVFISNHSNAANGKAYGVTVFRSLYLPESATLGQKLADAIVGVMKPVTGVTYSRGVKTRKGSDGADYYGVIRGSVSGAKSNAQAAKGPVKYSFIVEHGFHDHAVECAFLNVDANLKKIAQAEAKAIADYFGLRASSASSPAKPEPVKPETKDELYRVRKSWDDSKSQLGAYASLKWAKRTADNHEGYYVFDSTGKVVYPIEETPYRVRITADVLNVRKGPGVSHAIATTVKKNAVYTIVSESNGWGELKSGAGWINLSYTVRA